MLEENEFTRRETDQQASLRNFLSVLFKRKRIILTFFITVVAVVTAGSFIMPKIYQTESKLLLERQVDSEKALLFRMNLPQGYEKLDFINSEMEIIQSYPIAARVVKTFAADLMEEADGPLSEEEKNEIFEKAVKKFREQLEVENPKKSNILTIRYENKDAKLSAEMVNYFVSIYIAYRSEISAESDTYKFFEEQMKMADEKLSGLEQRQADFKEEKEVGSPESQRSILLTRLADYEKSLTAVRTKRIGKEAKLQVIKEQIQKGEMISIPSTESSDSPSREKHIARLKGELLDMQIKKEQLLNKFTPQYKEVVDLETQIIATKAKFENEIAQIVQMEENAIRALAAEERVLQSSINAIKGETRQLAQTEYEYDQISRGINDNREIYSMLLKQREEARISMAKLERGVKIKVISPAVMPTEPVSPKKRLKVILAIFLGLFGGLGLAFFVEYFDHTINTPEELERNAHISTLGSVREIEIFSANGVADSQARRILN